MELVFLGLHDIIVYRRCQATRVEELRGGDDRKEDDRGSQRSERGAREAGLPGQNYQDGARFQAPRGGHIVAVLRLHVRSEPFILENNEEASAH